MQSEVLRLLPAQSADVRMPHDIYKKASWVQYGRDLLAFSSSSVSRQVSLPLLVVHARDPDARHVLAVRMSEVLRGAGVSLGALG